MWLGQVMAYVKTKTKQMPFKISITWWLLFLPHQEKYTICKIQVSAQFVWGPQHSETFEVINRQITNPSMRKYYHPSKSLTLQTDASLKGHVTALVQEGWPPNQLSKQKLLAIPKSTRCNCNFSLHRPETLGSVLAKSETQGKPRIQCLLRV